MTEMSYEELREVQKKERSTGMLSELPGDFYSSAGGLVAKLKAAVNAEFAIEKAREYENALKVARDIYSVREQKILLRSLRAAKGSDGVTGLTVEERQVFEKVKDAVAEGENAFELLIGNGASKAAKAAAAEPARANEPEPAQLGKKMRVLSVIPQFVGLDGGKFGPFKPGETVFLPEREAELLLKRKLAADALADGR